MVGFNNLSWNRDDIIPLGRNISRVVDSAKSIDVAAYVLSNECGI